MGHYIMLIELKILGGKSCQFNVPDEAQVRYLKGLIEKENHIEQTQQKLVFKGKTLNDDKLLFEYGITDGSKVNLVVVKKSTSTATTSQSTASGSSKRSVPTYSVEEFWVTLEKVLLKRFTNDEADGVMQQYRRDYKKILTTMSLDDVERIATRNLNNK